MNKLLFSAEVGLFLVLIAVMGCSPRSNWKESYLQELDGQVSELEKARAAALSLPGSAPQAFIFAQRMVEALERKNVFKHKLMLEEALPFSRMFTEAHDSLTAALNANPQARAMAWYYKGILNLVYPEALTQGLVTAADPGDVKLTSYRSAQKFLKKSWATEPRIRTLMELDFAEKALAEVTGSTQRTLPTQSECRELIKTVEEPEHYIQISRFCCKRVEVGPDESISAIVGCDDLFSAETRAALEKAIRARTDQAGAPRARDRAAADGLEPQTRAECKANCEKVYNECQLQSVICVKNHRECRELCDRE